MLNPSKADDTFDDPTVRTCVSFARNWGFGSLAVVNLFAWRATDPKLLVRSGEDPVGPDNDNHIVRQAIAAEKIVCAWGASVRAIREPRARAVVALLSRSFDLHVIELTKDLVPRHPLYLSLRKTPRLWHRRMSQSGPLTEPLPESR
jgi:hypothetical protein